jgi:hypothetical protein
MLHFDRCFSLSRKMPRRSSPRSRVCPKSQTTDQHRVHTSTVVHPPGLWCRLELAGKTAIFRTRQKLHSGCRRRKVCDDSEKVEERGSCRRGNSSRPSPLHLHHDCPKRKPLRRPTTSVFELLEKLPSAWRRTAKTQRNLTPRSRHLPVL